MSNITNIQKNQPLHQLEVCSNAEPGSQVPVECHTVITVNVFFDGTGNNMHNTEARLEQSHTHLAGETSYENYFSNIALLYMACTERPQKTYNIYLQGSGTFKYQKDSTLGLGLAKGDSGLHKRVSEAFREVESVRNITGSQKFILNVFGFSRGAFYARYFCAMAKSDQPDNDSGRAALKLPPDKLRINLVGLYDTVSSHGVNHYNDVKPFQLNIGKKQEIARIVQLTAQNDYRQHFPLTRINTAVSEHCGFECSLPGAHSDIGGAYTVNFENPHDPQYLSCLPPGRDLHHSRAGEIHWSWFKQMGYYHGEPQEKAGRYGDFVVKQFTNSRDKRDYKGNYYFEVYAARRELDNRYQFIPLEIMQKICQNEASMEFNNKKGLKILTDDINSLDPSDIKDLDAKQIQLNKILNKLRQAANDYILTHYQSNGLHFKVDAATLLTPEEQLLLYHHFIHNSLDTTKVENSSDARNHGPRRILINDNV